MWRPGPRSTSSRRSPAPSPSADWQSITSWARSRSHGPGPRARETMTDSAHSPGFHQAALTPREALLFEAGVKLGGVFHQFVGMPVAPETSEGLARTIERAVRLQPFVTDVRVAIEPARGGPVGSGLSAYRYLTPEMMRVEVTLQDGSTT